MIKGQCCANCRHYLAEHYRCALHAPNTLPMYGEHGTQCKQYQRAEREPCSDS